MATHQTGQLVVFFVFPFFDAATTTVEEEKYTLLTRDRKPPAEVGCYPFRELICKGLGVIFFFFFFFSFLFFSLQHGKGASTSAAQQASGRVGMNRTLRFFNHGKNCDLGQAEGIWTESAPPQYPRPANANFFSSWIPFEGISEAFLIYVFFPARGNREGIPAMTIS